MASSKTQTRSVRVILTARDTADRLTRQPDVPFSRENLEAESPLINIYDDVAFQAIEGFGGAFTEAAAVTLQKMSPGKRAEALSAYFNPETGLGYTLCRTHINSCDFALGNYAYGDTPGDRELKTFSMDRDRRALLPLIQDALKVPGASFKLFASPWSPPGWMKTNGQMNRGGKLKDDLKDVWARYFVKYIQAYAEAGVPIWGVTVQNEPKATQSWDSCVYTAEEERDFVKLHLGPALREAGLADVKIMVWDHNKERIYERARTILSDPKAAAFVWGVAFHWYSGDHFEALSAVREKFPDKALLFTEGCQESRGALIGSWDTGERYGHDMIGDLNHGTVGWVDWNMVLDERGGPNHVNNFCDAPIIADTRTDTLTFQSSYYYIGHISRFVKPGARRIGFSRFTDKLEVTAFKNPDGGIAVVVMNRTDSEIAFYLRNEHGLAPLKSPAHSMMTLYVEKN